MKKTLFHHNWILAPLALLNSSMCSLELATLWYLRYLNKSAALATFEKKSKKSHNSVLSFENPAPNRYWKLYDMIKVIHGLCSTVKLDFKELLNKGQIDFKELFTDYQLFYTINLLLNKELLPIEEMSNLALRNFRSWKLEKKGTFFWTNFGILYQRKPLELTIRLK